MVDNKKARAIVVISNLKIIILASIAVLGKLWLIDVQQLTVHEAASHDDRLFVELARHLLASSWLGPYDQMTLVKLPFYPLWLAFCAYISLPLFLAQQLLYAVACALLIVALRPILVNSWLLLGLFLLLLFNPMSFSHTISLRIIREGIYPALSLLVIATSAGLMLRAKAAITKQLPWAVGLGLSGAAFYLTRSEAIWLLPAVLLLLGFGFFRQPKRVLIYVIPLGLLILPVLIVKQINKHYYGVSIVNELHAEAFLAAYSALTRVQHQHWHPYIPVPHEVREQLYSLSPAFAQLKPAFEGDIGQAYEAISKSQLAVNDIAAGWLVWALRDAVTNAGYHQSADQALVYYQRLAREVNSACDKQQINCNSPGATLMSPWHDDYYWPLINALSRTLVFLINFKELQVYASTVAASDSSTAIFQHLSHEIAALPVVNGDLYLRGVAFSQEHRVQLVIRDKSGKILTKPALQDSQDLYQYLKIYQNKDIPASRQAYFETTISCADVCYIDVFAADKLLQTITLGSSDGFVHNAALFFYLDVLSRHYHRLTLLRGIGALYQWLMPWLCILALIFYVVQSYRILGKWELTPLWWFNTALLVALSARVVLLGLIDTTAFLAINAQYLAPAYPILLTFVLLSLSSFITGDSYESV